jgi:ketosteroid isomerase-like protein
MTGSAAAVVRRFFDRYEQAGVDGALELITPDTVLVVPPEASAEPDTYRGHDGGRRYFAGFEGALDDVSFELVDIEATAPEMALVEMRLRGRGAATGIPVAQTTFLAITVRGDKILRIVANANRESARLEIERSHAGEARPAGSSS